LRRADQHLVSLRVINKTFPPGIPVQGTIQFHGHCTNHTYRIGTLADFRRRYRLISGFNTIDKVLFMIITSVKMNFIGINGVFEQRLN